MTVQTTDCGPLSDVRVLDLGHVVAGPFAGSLLGDLGADVIKVENPRTGGDSLRLMSPKSSGVPLWWKVAGRNKRSLGLDLKTAQGRQILLDLVAQSDVLIENFRAGKLEKLGLGPEVLHRANPRLIVLRISGYGQSNGVGRPGFGRVGEALSGAANLTGEVGGRPLHVGFSLGDATTGLMGAFGVLAALHARERTGRGDVIDLALFESLFRMIEWQLPVAEQLRQHITRSGNRFPIGYAVAGSYNTNDDRWVTISAATQTSIEELLAIVGGEELAHDVRFRDAEARSHGDNLGDLDQLIAVWVAERPAAEVFARFAEASVALGYVYDAEMMLEDVEFRDRGAVVVVEDAELGSLAMPGVIPKLLGNPGAIRWTGPSFGAHTSEVLRELVDLSDEEIDRLYRENVIR